MRFVNATTDTSWREANKSRSLAIYCTREPFRVWGSHSESVRLYLPDRICNYTRVVLGQRTAQAITDAVLAEVKKAVSQRLGGKSSGSSGSGNRGGSGGNDVVELTDSNFEKVCI